ncbi:hypothetical protein SAMN05518672_11560 [Chitinophaga sp. CF118]|nr:hypothetical protein SAMN05518672_11560 [Chitinophaga sp. CF118]
MIVKSRMSIKYLTYELGYYDPAHFFKKWVLLRGNSGSPEECKIQETVSLRQPLVFCILQGGFVHI